MLKLFDKLLLRKFQVLMSNFSHQRKYHLHISQLQLVVRKNRDENEVNGRIVNLKKCTQCRNLNDDTSSY